MNFLIHKKDTKIIISTDLGQCYAWRGTAGMEAIIHCQQSPSSNISLLMVHTLRVTISSLCHFCLSLCQSWGIPDLSSWSISCFLSQTILGPCWKDFHIVDRKTSLSSKSFWEQSNLNFQVYVVTAAFRLAGCPHWQWQALSTLLGTLITCYTCGYISELLQANQTRLYFITRHTTHILNQNDQSPVPV